MSIGGVATPMCHGGGIMHKTIADRILKIGKSLRNNAGGEGGHQLGTPLPIFVTMKISMFLDGDLPEFARTLRYRINVAHLIKIARS